MYSVVGARGEARDGPERVRRLLRVERAGARLSLDRGEEGMKQLCERAGLSRARAQRRERPGDVGDALRGPVDAPVKLFLFVSGPRPRPGPASSQARRRGVAQEAHERAVDTHTELRAAPDGVRELLGVELGGVHFGRAFDGGDQLGGGFDADAEFPARVQQTGELPALDVPGVVSHEAGRGGEERRDVWITPFARHEPPPVGRPRDAAQRGAAVHDVELRHRAAHDREHVRCERASRELCVDLHLPLAHDDAGFRTKRTRPRYPDSLSRARRRDHHRVPPPPPSRSRIVSAVY